MLYSNNELKKLIIPLIFEQLLAILVGMVDTIYDFRSGGGGCIWCLFSG